MTEKELAIAREKMQEYVLFALHPSVKCREFYEGAVAAINDLLCALDHGDAVEDLIEMLNTGEGGRDSK